MTILPLSKEPAARNRVEKRYPFLGPSHRSSLRLDIRIERIAMENVIMEYVTFTDNLDYVHEDVI